jgi:hypothetical protein
MAILTSVLLYAVCLYAGTMTVLWSRRSECRTNSAAFNAAGSVAVRMLCGLIFVAALFALSTNRSEVFSVAWPYFASGIAAMLIAYIVDVLRNPTIDCKSCCTGR